MWYISYTTKGMTSWWLTFFLHISLSICFQSNHNSNINNSNALQQQIMATKISNAMLEIQAPKNFFFFPIAPSLKSVVTSLSNEKEEE
jgi:hypothetical protein